MFKKEFSLRLIVFISIAIALFAFLGLHGTISSGFHFVDNHEVVQINKDYSDANGNLFKVASTWVKNDLGGRFRPMYMIDNVFVDVFFKGNFFLISIYHTILMVFIAFFLFLVMRKNGFNVIESLAFPLIAFVGQQSAILWRLGPNESIGMWYLSLTLLSMVYAVKAIKYNRIFQILFCLFGSLMILCKESFLILTPSIILAYIFLEKNKFETITWLTFIKKHLIEICILIAVFLGSLIFIIINVNTENLGYAGIKGVEYKSYLIAFQTLFISGGMGIISLILFALSLIVNNIFRTNKNKCLTHHIWVLLISITIVLPQVILYGKSGIFERYFLPGVLAWALLIAFSLKNIRQLIDKIQNRKYIYTFLFFEFALLFCLLFPRLIDVSKEASLFTAEGKEVNTVLSFISQNVDSTETVLFIADPVTDFERTISFRRFLIGNSNITKLYTLPVIQDNTDDLGKSLINDFSWVMGGDEMNFNKLTDKSLVQSIVVFPLLSDKGDQIVSDLGFMANEFNSYRIGSYYLYFRNKNLVDSFTKDFKVKELQPFKNVYNETAFYPELIIKKGSNVRITIKPTIEIKPTMTAFIILLDAVHPENIAIHEQISGAGEIVVSKLIVASMVKPCVIYRNWGKEQSIPSANISISSEPKTGMIIPISYL
ncbi:MAG: hypothetical protein GZ091_01515 [Paludibacter sp.]|nr:hypothetical protein [Paludibacter sp.]